MLTDGLEKILVRVPVRNRWFITRRHMVREHAAAVDPLLSFLSQFLLQNYLIVHLAHLETRLCYLCLNTSFEISILLSKFLTRRIMRIDALVLLLLHLFQLAFVRLVHGPELVFVCLLYTSDAADE